MSLDETRNCATLVKDSTVLHAIIPVTVHQKGSNKVISTYCFYDNGSSGCFVTKGLYEQLGAFGEDTRLRLKTLHGSSNIQSTAVNDLIITVLVGNNAVELPRTYTRMDNPVSAQQITSLNSTMESLAPHCGQSTKVPKWPTY